MAIAIPNSSVTEKHAEKREDREGFTGRIGTMKCLAYAFESRLECPVLDQDSLTLECGDLSPLWSPATCRGDS
jgi:hypothetical protein